MADAEPAEPAKPSAANSAAQRNLQALHDELLQFAEEVRCLPACLLHTAGAHITLSET